MQLNVDSHFLIGKDHLSQGKPCQDYAVAGHIGSDGAYAIVSDGCSTGGRTDVGARLVAHTMATIVEDNSFISLANFQSSVVDPNNIGDILSARLHQLRGLLRLRRDDLLATCLVAAVTPNRSFVKVLGDGVVCLVYKDGSIKASKFEWNNSTPFYPIYIPEGVADFAQCHADVDAPLIQTDQFLNVTRCVESRYHSLSWGIAGPTIKIERPEQLSYLALFSDGVMQVQGVDWKDVVLELMAIKNTKGVFATRRMNMFMRQLGQKNAAPVDDISCAMIHINGEAE